MSMSSTSSISRVIYFKQSVPCISYFQFISLTFVCFRRYKLPLTISDSSSTMDGIAFYSVAEELVETSAFHASQNMQIDPDNQPPVLNMAIGKTRLFYIGMSKDLSSKYPIKYVLKKSFKIDDHDKTTMLSTTKVTITEPKYDPTKVHGLYFVLLTSTAISGNSRRKRNIPTSQSCSKVCRLKKPIFYKLCTLSLLKCYPTGV